MGPVALALPHAPMSLFTSVIELSRVQNTILGLLDGQPPAEALTANGRDPASFRDGWTSALSQLAKRLHHIPPVGTIEEPQQEGPKTIILEPGVSARSTGNRHNPNPVADPEPETPAPGSLEAAEAAFAKHGVVPGRFTRDIRAALGLNGEG